MNCGLRGHCTWETLFSISLLYFCIIILPWDVWNYTQKLLISMLPTSLNMHCLNILIYTNTSTLMFIYTPKWKPKRWLTLDHKKQSKVNKTWDSVFSVIPKASLKTQLLACWLAFDMRELQIIFNWYLNNAL
jgi:hypothetical protein